MEKTKQKYIHVLVLRIDLRSRGRGENQLRAIDGRRTLAPNCTQGQRGKIASMMASLRALRELGLVWTRVG